ncbi:hypothetical protein FF1_027465 [Malus domestica]
MGATTLSAPLPSPVNQVSAEVPLNPLAPTVGQATVVQLTTQAVVMVEPVVAPLVEELTHPELVVAPANIGPGTTIMEVAATTVERNAPLIQR